jgi:hypothetical protein
MRRDVGWASYGPLPEAVPVPGVSGEGELRPELADVRRLLRRAVRGVIGAARAGDGSTLSRILADHLGVVGELEVVAEAWPPYEHVNVQAGLDAWSSAEGRQAELVGIVGWQHRPFGLAELLAQGPDPHDPFGPSPGTASPVNRASGPDGEVRPCLQCALLLVTEGDVRTAVLVRGPEAEMGRPVASVQIVSTDPGGAAATAAEIRRLALERNVFRGQVSGGWPSSGTCSAGRCSRSAVTSSASRRRC